MSNNIMERKTSEQKDTMKAMIGSAKQPERKMSSLQENINLLQKTKEEVMVRFIGDKNVLRKNIKKVAESVATYFAGKLMCISRAIQEWYI